MCPHKRCHDDLTSCSIELIVGFGGWAASSTMCMRDPYPPWRPSSHRASTPFSSPSVTSDSLAMPSLLTASMRHRKSLLKTNTRPYDSRPPSRLRMLSIFPAWSTRLRPCVLSCHAIENLHGTLCRGSLLHANSRVGGMHRPIWPPMVAYKACRSVMSGLSVATGVRLVVITMLTSRTCQLTFSPMSAQPLPRHEGVNRSRGFCVDRARCGEDPEQDLRCQSWFMVRVSRVGIATAIDLFQPGLFLRRGCSQQVCSFSHGVSRRSAHITDAQNGSPWAASPALTVRNALRQNCA